MALLVIASLVKIYDIVRISALPRKNDDEQWAIFRGYLLVISFDDDDFVDCHKRNPSFQSKSIEDPLKYTHQAQKNQFLRLIVHFVCISDCWQLSIFCFHSFHLLDSMRNKK